MPASNNNTKMLITNSFKRRLLHFWLFLVVVFHCLQRYLGKAEQNQMLRIIRGVRFVSDDFLLPESMCLNTTDPCPSYRAARNKSHGISGCLCYCLTTHATFYEPKRLCVENKQVRTYSGNCKYNFKDENIKEELLTLSLFTPLQIESPPGEKCKIGLLHKTGNKYLNCNGQWESIPHNEVYEKFETNPMSSTKLYLKLQQDGNITVHPHLNGRLIKLVMECHPIGASRPLDASCVLFKVHGTITCPLMINQPTTPTHTTTNAASMHEISTSLTTKMSVATNDTLIPETSRTAGQTFLTDKAVRTTVQTRPSAGGSGNNIQKTKLQNKTSHRTVAGIVGGVSGGLLLIFVAVLLTRRWPNVRLPGAVVSSDDVDGHEMYMGPSVSTLQRERARTISRDSGRYTETWYEEVPDDKVLKGAQIQESLYQQISSPAQEPLSSDSQLYDDIRTAESNSGSIYSNQQGFFNPGFQKDPEHDNSKSQTCSSSTETKRKEHYESRYVELEKRTDATGTSDEQYVELEEDQNHVIEDDKPDENFIDQNPVKSTDMELESSSSSCLGFPTSGVSKNDVRKSNGNSFGDESEYIEVIGEGLEPSPRYENADRLFDEANQDYEIPTMSIPSQTCPGSPESAHAAGYEQMGCQASEVDEAGYSVASELFPTNFSTKL